ncbi:DUF2460 domain-containing protein [Castellaniella sp.]|uniref:DUF2460 domain-containing protein n=1 Tax=Castellaniella sp. TaxID=1955812 RepID=UPI00355D21E0
MDFKNVRLSDRVLVGAIGGPGFKTLVRETASGTEYRNIVWRRQRGKWEIGYTDDHEKIKEIVSFFHIMQGRAYGFRFKDWSDYEVDNAFAVADGFTSQFQATKIYQFGEYQYPRALTRLVAPVDVTVVMPPPEGDDPPYPIPAWSVNLDTGIIAFTQALPYGATVAVKAQFDIPARFDIDELPIEMVTQDISRLESVPIVEIRE